MLPLTHIFFDLDGTLVDSFPGIEFSARAALKEVMPDAPVPDFRAFIGPPIRQILRCALQVEGSRLDALVDAFRHSYDETGWRKTRPYQGATEALTTARTLGLTCSVITNKPAAATHLILDHLGMAKHFVTVVTPESGSPPHSTKVAAALETRLRFGLSGPETMLVGDSIDDAEAANSCGFRFGAIDFGYGEASRQHLYPIHLKVKSLPAFTAYLQTLKSS